MFWRSLWGPVASAGGKQGVRDVLVTAADGNRPRLACGRAGLSGRWQQFRHPDKVVGGRCERSPHEVPLKPCVSELATATHRLHPPEYLFHPLPIVCRSTNGPKPSSRVSLPMKPKDPRAKSGGLMITSGPLTRFLTGRCVRDRGCSL